jgi:tetratricopeptide (TPR) repeat protein
MKIFGLRFAGVAAASFLGLVTLAQPARLLAQTASIHGHVQNPAGMPLTTGEVRLSTDKNPSLATAKFEYTFPIDANGDYKGTGIKPGSYIAGVFQQGKSLDFMPQMSLAAGDDKAVDFDMTRKEYIDKMSPADRAALEEYKKNAAATMAANAKIGKLNELLNSARTANKAGNYDEALKDMTDATAAKPDEAILWDTLGDAQLGQATVAAKASKATDPAVQEKFAVAETSYQKALDLNSKSVKPSTELIAVVNNQLGQAYGKTGKVKEAADAYEAAAKADPQKAGMYYYNEAATLFNASDMDNAAAAADKAVAADPTKVDAYYIKGQALIQKATVDPKTNKITAPPECVAAYQKYLELAPTGPHAEEIKAILEGIGEPIKSTYKAGKK